MTAATTVVLFGATGDLSKRKLLPGLMHLLQSGLMDDLRVVATSLEELSHEEFLDLAATAIRRVQQPRRQRATSARRFAQRTQLGARDGGRRRAARGGREGRGASSAAASGGCTT